MYGSGNHDFCLREHAHFVGYQTTLVAAHVKMYAHVVVMLRFDAAIEADSTDATS
jgi:hypothetical protein